MKACRSAVGVREFSSSSSAFPVGTICLAVQLRFLPLSCWDKGISFDCKTFYSLPFPATWLSQWLTHATHAVSTPLTLRMLSSYKLRVCPAHTSKRRPWGSSGDDWKKAAACSWAATIDLWEIREVRSVTCVRARGCNARLAVKSLVRSATF